MDCRTGSRVDNKSTNIALKVVESHDSHVLNSYDTCFFLAFVLILITIFTQLNVACWDLVVSKYTYMQVGQDSKLSRSGILFALEGKRINIISSSVSVG